MADAGALCPNCFHDLVDEEPVYACDLCGDMCCGRCSFAAPGAATGRICEQCWKPKETPDAQA